MGNWKLLLLAPFMVMLGISPHLVLIIRSR
jgi:hypothetical protein